MTLLGLVRTRLRFRQHCVTVFATGLLVVLVSGCGPIAVALHKGDGQLTYHGMLSYSQRYTLDFGSIDLTRRGTYEFRLSGLVAEEMVAGLRVLETRPNTVDGLAPTHPAVVRIRLVASDGSIVIAETRRLDEWTRSHGVGDATSEYYIRGEGRDIPIGNGTTRGQRLNAKPHGGWGTYFRPVASSSYVLSIDVLEPDQHEPSARIQMTGW